MRFLTLTPSGLLTDRDGSDQRVCLQTTEQLGDLPDSALHRLSPIHPVVKDTSPPILEFGNWQVHLLVPEDPFSLLGRIANFAYAPLESATWFGIGLASVLIFLSDGSESETVALEQLCEDQGRSLWSHEIWTLSDGVLKTAKLHRTPPVRQTPSRQQALKLNDVSPAGLSGIVQEFDQCVRDARVWSSVYAPDEVRSYDHIRAQVGCWVTEVGWLNSDRSTPPPSGLAKYRVEDSTERSQLVMQRFDRIVQINSALSYVISQSFFGAPPISQRTPIGWRYSLLGIGRAHRALTNLVRQIEYAFSRHSLPSSIHEKWGEAPPLECPASEWSFGSESWAKRNHPDHLLLETDLRQIVKLPYFSGRNGYREAEYSVSAAMHALTCADSPEWHIATMTHEMLHGHVREILEAVFSPSRTADPVLLSDFWKEVFRRFCDHISGAQAADFTLVDSTRSIILSYCCLAFTFGSLTRLPSSTSATETQTEVGYIRLPANDLELRQSLALEFKNINEIIVHVLDYFYFYSDQFDQFSRAVWLSWRTVPAVLSDVRQYVLRMMLVYTSADEIFNAQDFGDFLKRFARARHQVLESVKQLNRELGGDDPVLSQAERLLELIAPQGATLNNESSHPLFRPFAASVRVAHLARHCFTSSKIKKTLFNEDFRTGRALVGQYDVSTGLTPGEFSDAQASSVAEFVAWRARSNEAPIGDNSNVERFAAWLFLACGLLPTSEGSEG